MTRRIFAVSSVALLFCTGTPAFTQQALAQVATSPKTDPAAIVTSLYEAVVKNTAAAGFGIDPKDRKLLTKSLDTLWKKADKKANPKGEDVGAISFDIVSMSQDPNVKSFTVKAESQDPNAATIAATFAIGDNNVRTGQKQTVRYDFTHEGGRWKIDNVRSEIDGKPWSLRDNLAASMKD